MLEYVVSKVKYEGDLKEAITKAVDLIGGFKSYIKPGQKVILKPNYNSSDPPPASSDPILVSTLVRFLKDAGAKEVIVGDSSMFLLSTDRVFDRTGMREPAEKAGAKVVVFGDAGWVKLDVGERYLKDIEVAKEVTEADSMVYACCLKTHRLADYSISLKLGMGLVRSRTRIGWHLRGRENKIAELNTVIKPNLIILDARRAFITGGPFGGKLAEPNLILASNDRVALDVEGMKIIKSCPGNTLKRDPWEYTQIRRAVELGIGSKSDKDYLVIEKV